MEVLIFRLCCGCGLYVTALFSDCRDLEARVDLSLLGMLDIGYDIGV